MSLPKHALALLLALGACSDPAEFMDGDESGDVEASCGDGVVDAGEECDAGPQNDDSGACTSACRVAACGDGLLYLGQEECDDSNLDPGDGCSPQCAFEECGNAVVDPGEACDDGNDDNSDGCPNDCLATVCGDGVMEGGEACDDGDDNGNGQTACTQSCELNACGDGYVFDDEDCDDANDDDFDDCPSDCLAPECGDGVHEGLEDCDDGEDNGDGVSLCTVDCVHNVCGDGYRAGDEDCDDANDDDFDDCPSDCFAPECGDGVHEGLEICDDGNGVDGDGCDNDCEVTEIVAVEAGATHTCALTAFGGIKCWGGNEFGQLGYGDTENIGDDEEPSTVGMLDVGGTVVQIAAGDAHTCVLLDDGSVKCWGSNSNGQLGYPGADVIGDDEGLDDLGAVDLDGRPMDFIAAGGAHTCAAQDSGLMYCWGAGASGQLGYGNTDDVGDNETPADNGWFSTNGDISGLSAGYAHTCVVTDPPSVPPPSAQCWGDGQYGRLGYGNEETIGDDENGTSAGYVDLGASVVVTQISAGYLHTCATMGSGSAYCWGSDFFSQLGNLSAFNVGDNEVPASVQGVSVSGFAIETVAASGHSCALLDDGGVQCWGLGPLHGYGEEYPLVGNDQTPGSLGDVDLGGPADDITAAGVHTCVVIEGAVRCWGDNGSGQLGHPNVVGIGDDESPASAGDVPLF